MSSSNQTHQRAFHCNRTVSPPATACVRVSVPRHSVVVVSSAECFWWGCGHGLSRVFLVTLTVGAFLCAELILRLCVRSVLLIFVSMCCP